MLCWSSGCSVWFTFENRVSFSVLKREDWFSNLHCIDGGYILSVGSSTITLDFQGDGELVRKLTPHKIRTGVFSIWEQELQGWAHVGQQANAKVVNVLFFRRISLYPIRHNQNRPLTAAQISQGTTQVSNIRERHKRNSMGAIRKVSRTDTWTWGIWYVGHRRKASR